MTRPARQPRRAGGEGTKRVGCTSQCVGRFRLAAGLASSPRSAGRIGDGLCDCRVGRPLFTLTVSGILTMKLSAGRARSRLDRFAPRLPDGRRRAASRCSASGDRPRRRRPPRPPTAGAGGAAGRQASPRPSAATSSSTSSSRCGWVFGIILLIVSIALVALVRAAVMDLRMGAAIPPGFVEDFTDTVNKRQFKDAYELAKDDDSFLGRVLTTGMSRLQYGIEDAREAAFNMVESIKAGKEQSCRLPGHHRHAGAAARPGRHGVRHDPRLHGAGRISSRQFDVLADKHLARPRGDAARHRPVGAGHLLPRVLQEPADRASRWTRPTSPTTC